MTGLTTSSPRLLVPIQVDVAVFPTQTDVNAVAWAYAQYGYTANNVSQFNAIEPTPLGTSSPTQITGATIKWTLPDALTRQNADGTFPPVPDGWLVVRRAETTAGVPQAPVAWIVQSSAPNAASGCPYVTWANETATDTPIGAGTPLSAWTGAAAGGPTLTAVGPGNPSFAAFLPNVQNVFAYNDPLTDLQIGTDTVTLSYWVMGWYLTPSNDPLAACTADTFESTLAGLGWDLPDSVPTPCPTQSLYHGASVQVRWSTQPLTVPNGVPGTNANFYMGIGNTTTDALAAALSDLIASGAVPVTPPDGQTPAEFAATLVTLIQAAQYGLLERWTAGAADFETELATAVHDAAFAKVDSGTVWQLAPPAGSSAPPAPDAALSALMATLNADQATLDQATLQQASLASEAYANWWRQGWLNNNPMAQMSVGRGRGASDQSLYGDDAIAAYKTSVDDLRTAIGAVNAARAAVAADKTAVQQNATFVSKQYGLNAVPTGAFVAPADPVIVVANAGRKVCTSDVAAGNGALPCRLTGDLLSGITVWAIPDFGDPQGVTVTPAELAAGVLGSLDTTYLPDEAAGLLGEMALVDPAFLSLLANAVVSNPANDGTLTSANVTPAITALQDALLNITDNADGGSNVQARWQGTVPAAPGVSLWEPAWDPLYLDWQINYWDVGTAKWSFDPEGGDYSYAGTIPNTTATQFAGRTALSSSPVLQLQNLIGQLQPYANEDDDVETLVAMLQSMGSWDLLAQRLTGFNEALVSRSQQLCVPITVSSPAVTQGADDPVVPVLEDVNGYATAVSSTSFLPLRAGVFTLSELAVVDRFGQMAYLYNSTQPSLSNPGGITYANPLPASAGEQAASYGGMPPRIVQATRLNLDLVDAETPTDGCAGDPAANPVCGWLLPNHLDYALAVYDTGGSYLGEIAQVGGSNGPVLQWAPPPGSNAPLGAPPAIADPSLSGFVAGLLQQADGPNALSTLLSAIDESAWASSTFDNGRVSGMAALIGRPIAVVRTRASIAQDGFTAVNLNFAAIKDQYTSPDLGTLANLSLPVQIGSAAYLDNGILAYFQSRNFATVYTTYAPTELSSPYVVSMPTPVSVPVTTSRPGSAVTPSTVDLVMLVDPRGALYAVSGVFPVQRSVLPPQYVTGALSAMAVSFRVGPLLSEPDTLRIPVPAMGAGRWSWTQRQDVSTWASGLPLVAADAQARLPDMPPVVRQGWLQLASIGTGGKRTP